MTNTGSTSAAEVNEPRYYNRGPQGRNGLTRESIRQVETNAMPKFRRKLVKRAILRSDLLP